jgi:hypothetical protein
MIAGHIRQGLQVTAAILLLYMAPTGATAASLDWPDPYLTDDPSHYPQPQAVESVPRADNIRINPSMVALPPGTVAESGSANGGARIDLLQVVRSDEIAGVPAPDGMEAIILFTRWTNVHPRQKVSRASLEGGGDRSSGAGGLFSGADKEAMVDLEVAYKVPVPSRHLWLIVGGEAFQLRPESGDLPDGMVANKAFGIARMGQTRDARMAWFVPKGMNDIALRLFDYENGHVALPVAGDMKNAASPTPTQPVDAGKSGELELGVLGMRDLDSYAGQKAPAGWRFVAVDLLGKSIATQGKMGALLFADPAKYIWLSGDGATLHYGLPPADGTGSIVFTPDVASRQSVAFVVPEKERHFRLGIRGRSDVLTLKATGEPPAAMPPTVAQVQDTGSLILGLVGLRREDGITILDLLATPESGGRGIEINTAQQFIVKAGTSEYRPDAELTRRLFRQPPEPFILPPGTPARFELAYALPVGAAAPSQLRYRGFSGEAVLPLEGNPIVEAKPGSGGMSATALQAIVVVTVPEASIPAAGAEAGDAAGRMAGEAGAETTAGESPLPAKHKFMPPTEKPKLMPVSLPPFDPAAAIAEAEPNDKPEQATQLAKGLAARGSLGPGDEYDWYSFRVDGEPQLWSIEAQGAGMRGVGIYAAGNRKMVDYEAGGKPQVRLYNLLLVPGRYQIRILGTSKGGEYTVRAVPLGRPDKTAEFEPNDDASQAQFLRFGEARQGLIDHASDVDSYRFSLNTPRHLLLSLIPPPDTKLLMSIQGGVLNIAGDRLAAPGEPSRYEAWLHAGDYKVAIKSERGDSSSTPYELKLDDLEPFNLPIDLEPNDTAADARPLGQVRHFQGSARGFDDWDWFRLPDIAEPTALTLHFFGGSGVDLRLADNGRLNSAGLKEVSRSDTDRVYSATIPPGVPAFLSVSNAGKYTVDFSLDPDPVSPVSPTTDASLSLALASPLPPMAAFRDQQQSAPLSFTATNRTASPQHIRLEAVSSADGWRVESAGETLELAPGESGTLRATLVGDAGRTPADREPVFVRARADRIASEPLQLPLQTSCAAPMQSPKLDMPLPASMLGGFDVAWTALGAEPVTDRDHEYHKDLFDGMTPVGQYFPVRSLPADFTVKLAGGTAQIAGITLFTAPYKLGIGPVTFTLLASTDGAAYREIIQGMLEPLAREQVFAFPSPVEASHVRLHLDKVNGLSDGPITALSEFKVIAVPGQSPFGAASPNIADPALGGHLVQVSWPEDPYTLSGILTEKVENKTSRIEPLISVDWVVGFQHERAARITRLEWQNAPKFSDGNRYPEQVAVSASIEGPNGPWKPIADWKLNQEAGQRSVLELNAPVWARFLRFSVPGNDKTTFWQLAETLRVFEEPSSDGYRSILAEWGHYRRDAYFERVVAAPSTQPADQQGPGNDRKSARLLTRSEVVAGKAQAGERVDWFRIDVPKGVDRLELAFRGDGAGRLEPLLEDAKGTAAPLEIGDENDGARIFHAKVVPGQTHYLKVEEAKRSIMFVWDESGSIGAAEESIYQAISHMADDINPLVESVNLMPLGEGDVHPLMPEWSSNPLEVKAAIGAYDRSGGSSNAETTLISAMKRLAGRQGNRVIILLTDAESGGGTLNSVLWQQFRRVQPRVFTLELQAESRAEYASAYQDKMQDWAAANHGDYRSFQTQADLDHAYERAACLMRRPAEYQVSWNPAPGAGWLSVAWEKGKAMSGATIELILDASGSMRSSRHKVDGRLKIDVAKEVMKQIIDLFPDDTQVGLRVYGHRRKDGSKGACEDSELITPIGPLDRKRLSDQIQSIKALGGTPIAYSLQQAGNDLARIEGPRHIVLITDGKEECKGDPAKAVEQIRDKGVDVRLDIVGFALVDKKDKEDMTRVAAKSGGRFFDAQNRDALAHAINEALAMPFEVIDGRENKVGAGLTGQGANALYQGVYTVIVHAAKGDVTVRDVPMMEGRTTRVILSREGERIGYRVESGEDGGKP